MPTPWSAGPDPEDNRVPNPSFESSVLWTTSQNGKLDGARGAYVGSKAFNSICRSSPAAEGSVSSDFFTVEPNTPTYVTYRANWAMLPPDLPTINSNPRVSLLLYNLDIFPDNWVAAVETQMKDVPRNVWTLIDWSAFADVIRFASNVGGIGFRVYCTDGESSVKWSAVDDVVLRHWKKDLGPGLIAWTPPAGTVPSWTAGPAPVTPWTPP